MGVRAVLDTKEYLKVGSERLSIFAVHCKDGSRFGSDFLCRSRVRLLTLFESEIALIRIQIQRSNTGSDFRLLKRANFGSEIDLFFGSKSISKSRIQWLFEPCWIRKVYKSRIRNMIHIYSPDVNYVDYPLLCCLSLFAFALRRSFTTPS